MPAESLQPDQLLAAAKDVRLKISPLPPIEPGNAEPIKAAFNSRFDFLELVDSFGDVPKEQLGGKTPGDKLKEEGLSAPAASSIYEVVMVASYPPENTNFPPDLQADIPAMMESIPPFLTKLSLGGELQSLIAPQYRLNIEGFVARGPKTIQAEYDAIVERLNAISQQKTLQPDQRLPVARDVISLLTLVSHPQTQNIVTDTIIPPDPTQPAQKPLPLSSIAASYLTTYKLGAEMQQMINDETMVLSRTESQLPTTQAKASISEPPEPTPTLEAPKRGIKVEYRQPDLLYGIVRRIVDGADRYSRIVSETLIEDRLLQRERTDILAFDANKGRGSRIDGTFNYNSYISLSQERIARQDHGYYSYEKVRKIFDNLQRKGIKVAVDHTRRGERSSIVIEKDGFFIETFFGLPNRESEGTQLIRQNDSISISLVDRESATTGWEGYPKLKDQTDFVRATAAYTEAYQQVLEAIYAEEGLTPPDKRIVLLPPSVSSV